jgi:hypothetical protein
MGAINTVYRIVSMYAAKFLSLASSEIYISVFTFQYLHYSIYISVFTFQYLRFNIYISIFTFQYSRFNIYISIFNPFIRSIVK